MQVGSELGQQKPSKVPGATRTQAPRVSVLESQGELLLGVSRTFALTIPELPRDLRAVVTNAYLLCRVADTIEDERGLTEQEKGRFQARFGDVVEGLEDASTFGNELASYLGPPTLPAEIELVRRLGDVIAATECFSPARRTSLVRCVRTMGRGMTEFAPLGRRGGLRDLRELEGYCYYVAGVVGEFLTDLFLEACPELEPERGRLSRMSVSFGMGLQLTNILKDVWEDRERGVCWLPKDVFLAHGFGLESLRATQRSLPFQRGIRDLVAIARGHLEVALEFTLRLPTREPGLRHFNLWAIGLALLTLRKIHGRLDYTSGQDVKITRKSVRATVLCSNLATRSNPLLRVLFKACALGLPPARRPDPDFGPPDPAHGPLGSGP